MIQNDFNKTQYEQNIDVYLETNKGFQVGGKTIQERVDLLKQFLPQGKTVFEIGSGPGEDAKMLEQSGYDVIASDFVEGFVNILKQKGLNATLFDAKNDELPGDLNAIYANAVFVHFSPEELSTFLTKAKQSLVGEKIIFFSVIKGNGSERSARARGFERDFQYYSKQELESILNEIGYKILYLDESDVKWIQIIAQVI
jgi:SAM-dependent methyltransferase